MANTTVNLIREPVGAEGKTIHVAVGASKIYEGIMVAQLDADATLVPGSTALSGDCIGVSTHEAAISGRCAVETDRQYLFANATAGDACSAATPIGWTVYMADDHTIADNSAGGTRKKAGIFHGMQDGLVKVWITSASVRATTEAVDVLLDDASNLFDTDNVEAALTQIVEDLAAVTATHGANMVGFQDGGNKTAAATVDDALDELYVDATSAQGVIEIPLASFADADGDIVKFGDGTADGLTMADSKSFCLRFNNHATPPAMIGGFGIPYDANVTANMTLKFLVSKSGATNNAGNTTTITVAAFNQVAGALHDADDDYGGATGAVVPNAPAKTTAVLSRTLAHANLPAAGSRVTLTIKPTDGTLDTDDFMIHRVWVEYTRKLRTA